MRLMSWSLQQEKSSPSNYRKLCLSILLFDACHFFSVFINSYKPFVDVKTVNHANGSAKLDTNLTPQTPNSDNATLISGNKPKIPANNSVVAVTAFVLALWAFRKRLLLYTFQKIKKLAGTFLFPLGVSKNEIHNCN